jgi:hypothetical protein
MNIIHSSDLFTASQTSVELAESVLRFECGCGFLGYAQIVKTKHLAGKGRLLRCPNCKRIVNQHSLPVQARLLE